MRLVSAMMLAAMLMAVCGCAYERPPAPYGAGNPTKDANAARPPIVVADAKWPAPRSIIGW